MLPASRHEYILDQLRVHGHVQIDELSETLGVSAMTIHRDLDRLAAQGLLRKVRGGALAVAESRANSAECCTCRGQINGRSMVVVHMEDGSECQFCCPHCGLIAMARNGQQVRSILVTDFLTGDTVSAQAARYVVDPELTICCKPTVLAFSNASYATRFQHGFGGQVMALAEAIAFMDHAMHLH